LTRFAEKLLKATKGAKGLVEPSYVYLPGVPGGKEIAEKAGVEFFSVPIELGVSVPLSDLQCSLYADMRLAQRRREGRRHPR
jgi:hypothetical protein